MIGPSLATSSKLYFPLFSVAAFVAPSADSSSLETISALFLNGPAFSVAFGVAIESTESSNFETELAFSVKELAFDFALLFIASPTEDAPSWSFMIGPSLANSLNLSVLPLAPSWSFMIGRSFSFSTNNFAFPLFSVAVFVAPSADSSSLETISALFLNGPAFSVKDLDWPFSTFDAVLVTSSTFDAAPVTSSTFDAAPNASSIFVPAFATSSALEAIALVAFEGVGWNLSTTFPNCLPNKPPARLPAPAAAAPSRPALKPSFAASSKLFPLCNEVWVFLPCSPR